MYKPPENSNRVKSIKSIFENNTSQTMTVKTTDKLLTKSKTELQLRPELNLTRQLSDPSKRNIKRTPAFRSEKNGARSRFLDNSKREPTCDSDNRINERLSKEKVPQTSKFADIRSKFNNADNRVVLSNVSNTSHLNQSNKSETDSTNQKNLSFLYSEPIPKALRAKQCDKAKADDLDSEEERFCNKATLKLTHSDCKPIVEQGLSDKLDLDNISLTDTLKTALKKPLPPGPAPKKPPRTFTHPVETSTPVKRTPTPLSFDKEFTDLLNQNLQKTVKPAAKTKSDPKYMLDKLENALRNNKIRLKKPTKKTEHATSGEESDDGVIVKTKYKRVLPNVSANHSNTLPRSGAQPFNFNCLNALGCTASTYERIKEPNSCFFVDCKKAEPVYAEPFQYPVEEEDVCLGGKKKQKNVKNVRNSLYYMSSPILGVSDMEAVGVEQTATPDIDEDTKQVVTCDTSSLSSAYASDVESASSTPIEENKKFITRTNKIKDIIQVFELKNSTKSRHKPPKDAVCPEDRVRELECQLRKTLDRSFSNGGMPKEGCCGSDDNSCSCGSATESAHEDTKDEMTNKFETYVKTVRVYAQPGARRDQHLFHCCLIVGLYKRTPYVKMKFPENVEIPAKIEQLCFPDGIDGPMDRSDKAQCYSLVITDDKGKRTFGYCRRIIPEGSENCLPLAYCILSKHRAPRFYKRILKELESRHGLPDKLRDALLSQFYYRPFPRPGESIKIDLTKVSECGDGRECGGGGGGGVGDEEEEERRYFEGIPNKGLDLRSYVIVNNTGEYGTLKKCAKVNNGVDERKQARGTSAIIKVQDPTTVNMLKRCNSSPALDQDAETISSELILALHQDSRYEDTGLKELHSILNTSILQKVFASLLLERKVILVSCVLSKLSSCIEALQSILYPFCWPHTLIPILPQSLWEIVEAPTPFVCGVLSVAVVNMYKIDNAMVVDLDEAAVVLEVGDEEKILPSALVKTWKNGLSVAKSVPVTDTGHGVLLSDAYLRVFIHSCGHYKRFIINGRFQKEAFIQHIKTKGIRRFLTWFTETTMFYSFLDQIQIDPSSFAIFDKRIQIYGSEESAVILDKMKDWKKEKTLGGFFKFD